MRSEDVPEEWVNAFITARGHTIQVSLFDDAPARHALTESDIRHMLSAVAPLIASREREECARWVASYPVPPGGRREDMEAIAAAIRVRDDGN